jgi:hypothetical protein
MGGRYDGRGPHRLVRLDGGHGAATADPPGPVLPGPAGCLFAMALMLCGIIVGWLAGPLAVWR